MLALTELNKNYESHTNMAKHELMLMKMWKEIDRVYASNDVVLPVLGTGISRFDDGPKDKDDLLRCMLCTFNSSGVSLNSKIKIVLYGSTGDIPLYEYALEQIYNIIDSRYRSRKPLIVTTNLTLTELKNPQDTAHARIYDRLLELCTPIACTGSSMRKDIGQAKLNLLKTLLA